MDSEKFSSTTLPSLPAGWEYRYLEDLLEPGGLSYGIVQPGRDVLDGVPVIRVKNLRNGRIVSNDVLRVNYNIENKYQRTRLRGDEVLLTLVGSVGEVAVVPPNLSGWNVARAIGVIRLSREISSSWIKLSLLSETAQGCMRIWQTNTVQATLNLRDVRRIPIAIPPECTRDAITCIAGALDGKIAINEQTADTCHNLAQVNTIRAIAGAPMVPLSDLAVITMGSSPPGETYNEDRIGIPFYQGSRDFGSRFPIRRVWCSRPIRVAPEGATLISVRAPVGRLNITTEESCIGRGVGSLVSKTRTPSVLFHALTAKPAIWAPFESEGTVFGAINKDQIELVRIPFASEESTRRLEEVLEPLDERVKLAFLENTTLTQLRDTLLPKLMSGELRVRDAEKVVEEVT